MVRDLAKGIVMRARDQREKERQQLRTVDTALARLAEIAQEHLQQELEAFVEELRGELFDPSLPRVTRGDRSISQAIITVAKLSRPRNKRENGSTSMNRHGG